MSSRVLTLVGVAAIAAAVWLAGTGRPADPGGTTAPPPASTAWVATAHQQGIVGYRDPAVAVSPSGRLVAFSEGRVLRVVPMAGGVDVSTARGEGQVRHLAWIDDRRIVFEDGGAALRWQLHEVGVGSRPLWPTATLEGSGATSGVTLHSQRAAPAERESRRRLGGWHCGRCRRGSTSGACASMVRSSGARRSPAGRPSWPAWASATEIACVLATADGDGVSVPCGAPPLVTQPALRVSGPIAFAPDGQVVYTGAANARGFLDLWRIARATGASVQLTATARDAYGPTVARDGTLVYKTQEYRTHLGELVDGVVTPLTTFQAETPWWHPTRPLISMTYGTWRRQIDDAKYPDIAQEVGVARRGRPAAGRSRHRGHCRVRLRRSGHGLVAERPLDRVPLAPRDVRRRVAAAHRGRRARSPHHDARPRRRGGLAALGARRQDAPARRHERRPFGDVHARPRPGHRPGHLRPARDRRRGLRDHAR